MVTGDLCWAFPLCQTLCGSHRILTHSKRWLFVVLHLMHVNSKAPGGDVR